MFGDLFLLIITLFLLLKMDSVRQKDELLDLLAKPDLQSSGKAVLNVYDLLQD